MIRYGAEKDYNLAREIWLENFTDSVDEVDFYFKNIYKKENFLILEEESEIKGSLHENPYNISFNNNLLSSFYIEKRAVLASPSKDGELISVPLEKMGFHMVRGSSDKNSTSSLISLIRLDRKSTRLNSSHPSISRMPSSA